MPSIIDPSDISKDKYLTTWVDIQPNGDVKSIYSGAINNPVDLLIQDDEVQKRHNEWRVQQRIGPSRNNQSENVSHPNP